MQLAIHRIGALAVAWALLATTAHAAAAPPLSGFWRMETPAVQPKPALTPAGAAEIAKVADREGDTTKGANDWCVLQGMPHVMDSAGPLDIIQGAMEITILTEHLGMARHIYIDGRKHVSDDVFDHSAMGDSIGAFKAGVLTVDTVGFSKGVGPFGAPRTDATHLVETFKVAGDKLTITSTWTDPAVYARPFTYSLVYDRLPANYTVDDYNCDPRKAGFYLPGALR